MASTLFGSRLRPIRLNPKYCRIIRASVLRLPWQPRF